MHTTCSTKCLKKTMFQLIISPKNAHILSSNLVSSHGFGTNVKVKKQAVLVSVKRDLFFGSRTRTVVLCKGALEREAEMVLEREIVRFMEMSKRPNEFPSRKELLDGGRSDLVDAIVKKGGWMAFGWDGFEDGNECDRNEFDDVKDVDTRVDSSLSCCSSSNEFASSSGRSVEAQKMLKAKQRGVDTGSRTLHLQTTYIIWPNSASEAHSAGSFDGWTTQRKMKRSQTDVFSLSLKLYPGRYEGKHYGVKR